MRDRLKLNFVSGIVLTGLLVCWTNWKTKGPRQNLEIARTIEKQPGSSDSNSHLKIATGLESNVVDESPSSREEARIKIQEQINERWRTPISFYGKAIDENGDPVPNAKISFEWKNLLGTSVAITRSDVHGEFSLVRRVGYVLAVKVSKVGYYSIQPHGHSFYYNRGAETHIPDVSNPVVFRLQKHGPVEPLNVFERKLQLSSSGRSLDLDLSTGEAVSDGSGDIRLQFFRETNTLSVERPIFSWRFSCTAVSGGLIPSTNAFRFKAPENGYVRSDDVEMKQADGVEWSGDLERYYFVRTADGLYSRVAFDLMAHNGVLRVKIFQNPNGSRNLEYRRD